MPTNKNYSITLSSLLDTSGIEKKIKELEQKKHSIKFDTDQKGLKDTTISIEGVTGATKGLDASMEAGLLTFQAANAVFRKTIEVLGAMVDQVYELDGAITEFRKVTDLSGESLDRYVDKLADMGSEVARTGKPKCLSRDVRMVNVH